MTEVKDLSSNTEVKDISLNTEVKDLSSITEKEPSVENDDSIKRQTWSGKFEFLLSCIGYGVGLGNVWRFPHLCYKNGGGAFLIPYVVMLAIAGIPLLYFELAIGQFSCCGPISVWKIQPMFKGIGYSMLIVASFVSIYYNVIVAWSLYYLFASFTSKLPWADCKNEWNDHLCLVNFRNASTVACTSNITTNCTSYELPAEQYWNRIVLGVADRSGKMRNMEPFLGEVQWHICLCLLLAWIICGACLIKGIKSSGKIVYFTCTFPYVVIIIMVVNGCLLQGSLEGIKYYIIPKWDRLLEVQVWADAATQIFYSLGIAFGGLISMASYNKFNFNFYRDSLIVSIVNAATSFLAGFAIFSVLGYMSIQTGKSVAETTTSGTGLAFVVYAQSLATMPVAPFWSVLFFAMLLTLGIDSQFGGMEAIFTGIQDEFPIFKKTFLIDVMFKIVIQIAMFFLGIPLVSKAGVYLFTVMDTYCGTFPFVVICLFEIISVMYIYGIKNFMKDVKMMLGFTPGYYWLACWTVISPVSILFILIVSCIYNKPITYEKITLPNWANTLGILMSCSSIVAIPIYFIIYAILKKFTITPHKTWGPGLLTFWEDDVRYSSKLEPRITDITEL